MEKKAQEKCYTGVLFKGVDLFTRDRSKLIQLLLISGLKCMEIRYWNCEKSNLSFIFNNFCSFSLFFSHI